MAATRLFHFVDGSSSKFWQITVDGNSFTADWGRIGTSGQSQTKEFASESAAQAAADKLIAEKVKKGYEEQGQGSTSAATPSASNRVAPVAAPVANISSVKRPAPRASAEKPVEAPVQPAPAPAIPAHLEVERRIDLSEEVLAQVPWREVPTLSRPETPAFDRKEALGRLAKVKGNYWWDWDWSKTPLSHGMSKDEAQFWFGAMTFPGQLKPKQVAEKLEAKPAKPVASLEDAFKAVAKTRNDEMTVLPLTILFGTLPFVDALIEEDKAARASASKRGYRQHDIDETAITEGLKLYALPYLSPEEREALKSAVRPEVQPSNWPGASGSFSYDSPPLPFVLAAALGMSEELLPVVESWPDDMYSAAEEWADHYQKPQTMIFALNSPEVMEHHFRRLKLKLKGPEQMSAWLARAGFRALDIARDSVAMLGNKDEADKMFAALAVAHGPEVAPVMLELMLNSKAPRQAREWLDANPQHTVLGLIPVAAGRGRVAEAAGEYLAAFSKKGGKDLIEAALARFPEETATRVRAVLAESAADAAEELDASSTPDWLKEALATTGKGSPPKWVSPQDLPPVKLGQQRLSDAQVSELLRALAGSTLTEPKPLVTAVKQHADRMPLERFAWRLFERWLSEGGPSKEKWAMMGVGLLGGDECALKLTPMVRAWPGESQHARAVLGLEVLRAIGTDTALMQINGIAQKLQFKGLKAKAAECMEGVASDRGMSRSELEDRIVPDCGLDERGSRSFDFGSRQFRLVLGAGLKPMVKDADGAVKPDLPKPNARDDAALSADAIAEWKLLKKQVAEVVKVQAVRLEQAMVTGRRWTREEFELLLVRHPLMTNLVRLVVWAAHDAGGAMAATFRVTEDQTYADSSDDTFDLTPHTHVSIVHPLKLNDADRAAWGELLSDYEIVPPFTQLGRALFGLEGGETAGVDITRFKNVAINPQSLVFTLEKLGWQRGIPEDGGVFYSHSKPFYGAGITAVVEYEEGVPVGYMEGWDDQKVTRCYFLPDLWKPEMYPQHKDMLKLGEVDAVVISEVLNDLTTIAAKGK